jgi:hypothetical protein
MSNRFVTGSNAFKTVVAIGMLVGLELFGTANTASGSAVTGNQLVAMPNATAVPKASTIPKRGEFDCNGFSPVETPARGSLCADVRGILGVDNANTWAAVFSTTASTSATTSLI